MQTGIVIALLQRQRRESFKGKNYFLNFHVIENFHKDRDKTGGFQRNPVDFIIYLVFRPFLNIGFNRPNSSNVRRTESEIVITKDSMEATTVMTLIIN